VPPSNDQTSESKSHPTSALAILGHQLRIIREECGVTREGAADHLGCHPTKISRIELGQHPVKDADLVELLEYYGIPKNREGAALLTLNARLNEKKWWAPSSRFLPEWYCSYLELESLARVISTYESRFIPGLLQTKGYAEGTIRENYSDEEDVRRRVDVRMQRQANLLQCHASLWAIIDDAALQDGRDDPPVMRKQLEFLIEATELPHITIQIVKHGARASRIDSFSILRLHMFSPRLPEVLYREHLDDALISEDPAKTERYRLAFDRIALVASKPESTRKLLEQKLRRLS
jgi:transcriptional regulator with XRE-family HTH domain